MDGLKKLITQVRIGQWILIATCLIAGVIALVWGISDNIPGILLLALAIACAAGTWVYNWRLPKQFWKLLIGGILAFPIGVIAHNLFYALAILSKEYQILVQVFSFFEAIFFFLAILMAGPVALVGLIGGVYTTWKGLSNIVKTNRSYRRFIEKQPISEKLLIQLVNLARLSASGANRQPLKFLLSNTEEKNQKIFPTLGWAAYLKDWKGPEEGERPSAYIIILGDTNIASSFEYDAGIACQSILLGAAENGLGGCIIGSINKDRLRENLGIPVPYVILLVLALGKPAEKVVIEDLDPGGDVKYWRDENGIHHVPKRGLEELIIDL
jgi:nitroreductase